MQAELRLYLDRFDAKSVPGGLPAVVARAVYVVEGSIAVRHGETTPMTLGPNSAMSMARACSIGGGSLPGRALRWELVPRGSRGETAAGQESRRLLSAPMTLDAPDGYLLRCDRVDFPPGGEALTHTHQGGGIRCLLAGSIRIETLGQSHRYGPFAAWFEPGPSAVYAAADEQIASAFARVMVLPRALLGGKTSIKYVNPDDLDKPKSQRYQIFIDEPIGNLA
jgi:hypothetical protein